MKSEKRKRKKKEKKKGKKEKRRKKTGMNKRKEMENVHSSLVEKKRAAGVGGRGGKRSPRTVKKV